MDRYNFARIFRDLNYDSYNDLYNKINSLTPGDRKVNGLFMRVVRDERTVIYLSEKDDFSRKVDVVIVESGFMFFYYFSSYYVFLVYEDEKQHDVFLKFKRAVESCL